MDPKSVIEFRLQEQRKNPRSLIAWSPGLCARELPNWRTEEDSFTEGFGFDGSSIRGWRFHQRAGRWASFLTRPLKIYGLVPGTRPR